MDVDSLVSLRDAADMLGVSRQNLLGATILKTAANRPKDHRDFAHLVAKIADPMSLRSELSRPERRILVSRMDNRSVTAQLGIGVAGGSEQKIPLRLIC